MSQTIFDIPDSFHPCDDKNKVCSWITSFVNLFGERLRLEIEVLLVLHSYSPQMMYHHPWSMYSRKT